MNSWILSDFVLSLSFILTLFVHEFASHFFTLRDMIQNMIDDTSICIDRLAPNIYLEVMIVSIAHVLPV